MWSEKVGLQLYSVRDDLEKDFYGTLRQVKEMGYSAVEFAGLCGHTPEEVKGMCEELGLVPISAHVPLDELGGNTEQVLDCYKAIGCRYVVIPYLAEEYRPGCGGFAEAVRKMKAIGEAAAKHGMVLQYHNHDFEFSKVDGKYALDLLYEEVGPEYLQTQLDTCWVNVGGENPSGYVRKYAGRVPTVHLKDFKGSKSEHMYALIGIEEEKQEKTAGAFEFRPLGMGLQDIPDIVKASIESGAEWFIVEQDEPCMDLSSMECAKASAAYLKTILE